MSELHAPALGWQRDLPDPRDLGPQHPEIRPLLAQLETAPGKPGPILTETDLSDFFAPAGDARKLNATSAYACTALVEYFQRRVHGRTSQLSAIFLYKTARKLLRHSGDSGVNLRTALKALTRFGLPPTRYWPNDPARFDEEPDPLLYSYHFTEPFRRIRYIRLDAPNTSGRQTLRVVKSFLSSGIPCVLGFRVPRSITTHPEVPYRPALDAVEGGQAVVAVGHDDRRVGPTARGSLQVFNPADRSWGNKGYGWLPYAYVEDQLAVDFWTVLREDWLESGEFTCPSDSIRE
jgi:C1A family cysteine protease